MKPSAENLVFFFIFVGMRLAKNKLVATIIFTFSGIHALLAQSAFVPTGSETYHFIDRFEIKNGQLSDSLHTSVKPYRRDQIVALMNELDSTVNWSPKDEFNKSYLLSDNFDFTKSSEAGSNKTFPLLRSLYTEKPFMLSYYDENFEVYANPVFDFNVGITSSTIGSKSIYTNTRGAEIRGSIAKKIGFYTLVTENQTRLPYYIDQRVDSTKSLPGIGFLKGFGVNGYDYLLARGYVTFSAIKFINFQFGHDRNFIGNGIRSMILSDFAREYLFLKVNTQVWKFNYQNMFMELFNGTSFSGGSSLVGKKYAAHHHISINIAKNFNLGLSETIIFSRSDSVGTSGFDFNYLNPIIFYRSVEQNLNSSDNAMVGLDFKWNFLRHFSFYGQVLLDEFVISELRSGSGWWANKFGLQGGIKYIDIANISNLDLQLETNYGRPFLYTHFKVSQNFSHYGQQLAHPLGANFYEMLGVVRYQPLNRLSIKASIAYSVTGLDTAGINLGQNIFKNYNTRYQEYGNRTGQGDKTTITYIDFYLSYMLKHNLFLWSSATLRSANSVSGLNNAYETWISLGVRLNFQQKMFLF
jgi:hypothetical protein